MLDKIRIDVKLALIVGLMVVGLAVIGTLAVLQGRDAEVTLVRMTESDLELLIDVSTLYGAGLQSGQATRNVLLNPADQTGKGNYRDANRVFLETIEHASRLAPAHPGGGQISKTCTALTCSHFGIPFAGRPGRRSLTVSAAIVSCAVRPLRGGW